MRTAFPSASPMHHVANTFTRPTLRTKQVRRPRSSQPSVQRTVKLGLWSAAIPVHAEQRHHKPHLHPQISSQHRTSLFPADRERQFKPRCSVPRLADALAPKTKYGTLKVLKHQQKKILTPNQRQQKAERKRKKKIKKVRHSLEHQVLALLACNIVDLSSTNEHQQMLQQAKQSLHPQQRQIDPYELPKSLQHRTPETRRVAGPDPNLLDVRTHEKIFRTFNPFEKQWLDMWGSQNIDKGNCNAHCVRSIYKWEELKARGRQENKKTRRLNKIRNNTPKKKRIDADYEKILAETNALLGKPL